MGLFFASLRAAADNGASGWWTAILRPAQLTLQSYKHVLENPDIVRAFWNTVLITVPASILVVVVESRRSPPTRSRGSRSVVATGYSWWWSRCWSSLQVALIPVARLYNVSGLFGAIPGVVLFHVAFGLPFAVFLLRNFFIGIPSELLRPRG